MTVVTRHDEGDVAVLTYAVPDQRMNVVTDEAIADLRRHVDELATEDRIVGAVLESGKSDNFCAGADLRRMPELMAMQDPRDELARTHSVIMALRNLGKPLVAAVHGPALGGGLEIAMACSHRVATDHERTRFGLPEVKLGLLPGAGGTQLLPRLIPAPVALEHLLTGKHLHPAKARALGLVDDVVPVNQLHRVALALVRGLAAGVGGVERPTHDLPQGAELEELIAGARSMAAAASAYPWPAPDHILDAVHTGLRDGLEAGLAAEREGFAALLASPEARAGVHLFNAQQAAKAAAARRPARAESGPPRRVFVLGGGMMGAGLGAQLIDSGHTARVRDLDDDALVGVRRYADKVLRRRYGKRRGAFPTLYRERIHRLSTTTGLAGLGAADVVIEAVFEDLELKHRVIAEAEQHLHHEAVFASNTSAIPITALAEASQRPDRFIGMHFFSPVDKMPLVEVIPHPGTSSETIARTTALATGMGKTPIVVQDSPGFYTSRVFGRWLAEGTRLLADGAKIDQIDRVAQRMGFPVGPLVAHDEVALELVRKGMDDPVTSGVTAERVDAAPSRRIVTALTDAGHLGRKVGRGFYAYDDEGRRTGPHPQVYALAGLAEPADRAVSDDEVRERLLWSFVTEALLCWDEGLLRSPGDGDVGAVLGIGYPPNLGGPFFTVDEIGAAAAVERIEALGGGQPGPFTVAESLRKLGAAGEGYAALEPLP